MKCIISVSKTYKHRGKNIKHRDTTKKHWQIMYLDHDEDGNPKLFSQFVNPLMALYYKTQKHHRMRGICTDCGVVWMYYVKSRNEKVKCPDCEN